MPETVQPSIDYDPVKEAEDIIALTPFVPVEIPIQESTAEPLGSTGVPKEDYIKDEQESDEGDDVPEEDLTRV